MQGVCVRVCVCWGTLPWLCLVIDCGSSPVSFLLINPLQCFPALSSPAAPRCVFTTTSRYRNYLSALHMRSSLKKGMQRRGGDAKS